MFRTILAYAARYERQLSGAGMVGGFAFDNYAFRRIDLPNTQLVFVGYLIVAAVSAIVLHWLITRAARGKVLPRWHGVLPMVTQFALGALWSAFLVFYSRGAVLSESWPFMLVLVAIFLGNEFFKHYHERLVFTATLFFFALISYSIVTLPIVTHTIGSITFLFSGVMAIAIFALFLWIVAHTGREQWLGARWRILAGAVGVYALLNAFYFTGILPPLPIALSDSGVYHLVAKKGDVYDAKKEIQLWYTRFGITPEIHVQPGEPIYFYSAVFAPIQLSTNIVHRWQRFDGKRKKWVTVSRVSFRITGGRDGGYRGYSVTHHSRPGRWRVDIDLPDGHIIGRSRFNVRPVKGPVSVTPATLE